jgi:hypothetical protein
MGIWSCIVIDVIHSGWYSSMCVMHARAAPYCSFQSGLHWAGEGVINPSLSASTLQRALLLTHNYVRFQGLLKASGYGPSLVPGRINRLHARAWRSVHLTAHRSQRSRGHGAEARDTLRLTYVKSHTSVSHGPQGGAPSSKRRRRHERYIERRTTGSFGSRTRPRPHHGDCKSGRRAW